MQTRALAATLALFASAACGSGGPESAPGGVCTDDAKQALTALGRDFEAAFPDATSELLSCIETSLGWAVTVTFETPAKVESVRDFVASKNFEEAADGAFEQRLGEQTLVVLIHDRGTGVIEVSGRELRDDSD